MATIFKTLTNNDVTTTRTLLHEAIPITGSLVSGAYIGEDEKSTEEPNIRNYTHGFFQSVYDYPYLSSSANHIFDVTVGFSSKSNLSSSSPSTTANPQQAKKLQLYNQMAQVLVGHDETGSIQRFDQNGNLIAGGAKIDDAIFLNFARLLVKDEVKKGSFKLQLMTGSDVDSASAAQVDSRDGLLTIQDHGGTTNYRTNSPAGDYGILYTSSADTNPEAGVGLIYYQAGIAVVTASVFSNKPALSAGHSNAWCAFGSPWDYKQAGLGGDSGVRGSLTGSTITGSSNGVRNRIYRIDFNNTTELNSTIYFCRLNHNNFNYSSNPTYLSESKIRVKDSTVDSPVTYVTTVGLYSADNELLAVAKLSEPIKKTPETELTLRVRLDY